MGNLCVGTIVALMTLVSQGESGNTNPEIVLFVAPDGNDSWSGKISAPNAEGADGPLATELGVKNRIRELGQSAFDGVKVVIRGGEYHITEPIVFTPEDSGSSADTPILFQAAEGETPVIHGGRAITNFEQIGALWIAELPEVAAGDWDFGSLWVNGERRQPARTPNAAHAWGDYPPDSDFFFANGPVMVENAEGKPEASRTAFYFRGNDLTQFPNLDNAHLVIFHSWATSLLRVADINAEDKSVTFTGPARWPFGKWRKDQMYFIEHHFEGLDQPGEWYLDKQNGKLYYMPMPGERIAETEVIAPVAQQLLVLKGDPANGKFVENIRFEGIAFKYTDFPISQQGHSDAQAAYAVNAAVELSGAKNITFKDCKISHTGNYGVWLRAGSQSCTVEQCEISDLGAGGVRIGEGASPENENFTADHNTIHNNFIHDGGKVFRSAVGMWIGRASHNKVTHNEIADFRYTGVSVGWSWGYAESSANHNNIDYNHIHHIGLGQLNDMGGIYTLGISPGTTLIGNVIHDVHSHPRLYGGWGLYTDEGSTGILMENNLVYGTTTGGFHQHYGKDNIVRNNILAYSIGHQVMRSREEEHNSFFFENNIVLYNNGQLLGSTWKNDNFTMDKNVYWDTSGQVYDFAGHTFEEWKAKGHDVNSIIADPMFLDAEQGDFQLKEDSPAFGLGFRRFDLTQAGIRGDEAWVDMPKQIGREPFTPPAQPEPAAITDDFEDTPAGESPKNADVNGATAAATIVVSEETAASGKHSLKITDTAGLERAYDPHLVYAPHFRSGTAKVSFALRIGADTELYHEWRDSRSPYRAGPSLWIKPGGVLRANSKDLATLPADTWIHFDITCPLGNAATGAYDLRVTWEGADAQNFSALPFTSADLYRLDWLGFVSQKDGEQTWWLDDVKIEVE